MPSYDEDEVINVIEAVSKSVVNLFVRKQALLFRFGRAPREGSGSGVIIDSEGHIVTNNHVVQGANKIGVALTDGRVLDGHVVGTCRTTDIALIKIEGKDFPFAKFADSSTVRVGQRVYAIGNALGLEGGPTVTAGIVSSLNRTLRAERGFFKDLVQTDAPINPGNSGGPLVNSKGEIIAINMATAAYMDGIGFAIPVDAVKECTTDILAHGGLMQPWLGVAGATVTPGMANYYNLPVQEGVMVAQVLGGGPAEKTGLEAGDIIIKFDQTKIASIEQLVKEVRKHKVGEAISLAIIRNGKRYETETLLDKTP